jgi:hypothetical protein
LLAVDRRKLGINTNFITDADDLRDIGRPFLEALGELGVKSLRYPGGEKADAYLWSVPPFTAPAPTLARTGSCEWPSGSKTWVKNFTDFVHDPLDFDEFMAYARALEAEVTLVVNFDSMYKPSACNGVYPTKQQLKDTAAAWVRYANITRKYGVKYWEIGNESFLDSYNGTATPENYARDFIEFARAMKEVDPTIQVGANGPSAGSWWKTVLTTAAPEIDFLSLHDYPCWEWSGYDHYRDHTPNFTGWLNSLSAQLKQVAPKHADRIRFAITELNATDWSNTWKNENNLGHALVLFEYLGELLKHPKVDHAQVWNTRWTDPSSYAISDTLGPKQELRSTGLALKVWGQFLHTELVRTTSSGLIRSFASRDPRSKAISLFLVNKAREPRRVDIGLKADTATYLGERWQLSGAGPEDHAPTLERTQDFSLEGAIKLELPAVSITVLKLTPVDP